jgi:hypothetical protein
VEITNRAYRALLDRLTLSDDHRLALRQRGLTDAEIARHGYATGPANPDARRRLAAAVVAEIGRDLVGQVPGFIRHRHGQLDLVCGDGELLIPVRDVQSQIVGIRRRPDDTDGGKYRWLSGGDNEKGGIGVDGHTVHVAYPPRPVSTRRALIVEGEIKANITADRLGLIVLSVAGVQNTGNVVAVLAALGGVEEVLIGYDADATTNEHVASAEARLAHGIAAAGYRVMQLDWPAEAGKGLDDILTSSPPTIPVAEHHPALSALAETPETPPEDVVRELVAVKRLHSLSAAARRSPNLGHERHVLTDFATALAASPQGEWVPMPYAKVGDQAGVDAAPPSASFRKPASGRKRARLACSPV